MRPIFAITLPSTPPYPPIIVSIFKIIQISLWNNRIDTNMKIAINVMRSIFAVGSLTNIVSN